MSSALVNALCSSTAAASTAGRPSAASHAVTPGHRTICWRRGVPDGSKREDGSTRFPLPWSDVSSSRTIGFRPVAASPSIASSSRQPVFSQLAGRASMGSR
ncbi:MAG: hypothetical protein WKF75_08305 [Singulisphaera sp.]